MRKELVFEFRRKFFHLMIFLFIGVYLLFFKLFGHKYGLLALVGALVIFLVIDFFKIVYKFKVPFFHVLWREKEKEILGGNVYFLIGAIIALAVFDWEIAMASIMMAVFGDRLLL